MSSSSLGSSKESSIEECYCDGICHWDWTYYPEPNPFHQGYWISSHACTMFGCPFNFEYTCECTEVGRDGYYEGETVFTICYHPI